MKKKTHTKQFEFEVQLIHSEFSAASSSAVIDSRAVGGVGLLGPCSCILFLRWVWIIIMLRWQSVQVFVGAALCVAVFLLPIEDAFLTHHTQDHCNENSCAYARRIQLLLILLRSITWSPGWRRWGLHPHQQLEVFGTRTDCVWVTIVAENPPDTPVLFCFFLWFTPTSSSSRHVPWNVCHPPSSQEYFVTVGKMWWPWASDSLDCW